MRVLLAATVGGLLAVFALASLAVRLPVDADIADGQYSMEVSVNETSVPVGGQFTAYASVHHSAGPYEGAQWNIDYDEMILDAGTIVLDPAASGACGASSKHDNGSRVLLACLNTSGPNITYSGTVFRVQFRCVDEGVASLTLTTGISPTSVQNGTAMQAIHLHHDSVTCGAGSPLPTQSPPTPAGGQESCTIAEVLTGDSFVCTNGERVRMLQIDAQDPGQCGGGWAKAALANIFLPVGRVVTLDFDADRADASGNTLAAPIARGTDGHDYNLSIVMVYVGLAKAADFGDGNTKFLEWAKASQVWASVAKWNMWAPVKTYTGGCD
jgi:hypothetical protein